MNRENEGYIPPLGASPIPPSPHHMSKETQYISVYYDADPEALEREVPSPLEFAGEMDGPTASLMIGDAYTPPKNVSHYHEAMIRIRVRYDGDVGWYTTYIWVDNEESLLNGRVNGLPKLLCDEDSLTYEGNEIHGEIHRRDQPLMRVLFRPRSRPDAQDEAAAEMGALQGGLPGLQLKKVQSPVKDGKVLRQLIKRDSGESDVAECYSGDASVELFDHASFPNLKNLAPETIHGSFFSRPDFYLSREDAEIVWESFE